MLLPRLEKKSYRARRFLRSYGGSERKIPLLENRLAETRPAAALEALERLRPLAAADGSAMSMVPLSAESGVAWKGSFPRRLGRPRLHDSESGRSRANARTDAQLWLRC
jgi:hypothetical protein